MEVMKSQRKPRFVLYDLLITAVVCITSVFVLTTIWYQSDDVITADFHRLYHDKRWPETGGNTYWFGVPTLKTPLDMWVYQEILYENRPDVIIETGTFMGGSSYYFASIFDLLGSGRVITIDIGDFEGKPKHDRVTFLLGSSTADSIVEQVKDLIHEGEKVMVVLDSDHSASHVRKEMEIYGEMVTPGQYMVVEDTHLYGHPVRQYELGDPWKAVGEYLAQRSDFVADRSREKYGLTFNPSGWLKKENQGSLAARHSPADPAQAISPQP